MHCIPWHIKGEAGQRQTWTKSFPNTNSHWYVFEQRIQSRSTPEAGNNKNIYGRGSAFISTWITPRSTQTSRRGLCQQKTGKTHHMSQSRSCALKKGTSKAITSNPLRWSTAAVEETYSENTIKPRLTNPEINY